jgi:glutamate-ammonia-ligase adenylyltransferase
MLYELDMRLRPSGNSGVLVIHISTFEQYQKQDAWTWEHQALVRARVVYGNEVITNEFNSIRKEVLRKKRDLAELSIEVRNMREKMRKHLDKSADELIDIKQGPGGLVDIEFLAQYLVLGYSFKYEGLTERCDNLGIYKLLEKHGILNDEEQNLLVNNYEELRNYSHKATLQNEALLINKSFLKEQQVVMKLCQKFID